MSREIKFRAWDKQRMIYFKNFAIGFTKSKKVKPYVYFTDDTFNGEVNLGSHEIMQFIGLLDKNGKEIYEGDKFKSHSEFIDFYEVYFEDGCFCMRYKINDTYSKWGSVDRCIIILKEWDLFEIVGNIYENTETNTGGEGFKTCT